MTSPLIVLLQAPDDDGFEALVSEDVRFHSPVADYEGRAVVTHLFRLIAEVTHSVQPTREIVDGALMTSFISGLVQGEPVQGVVDERYDDDGLLVEATLMLRPLAALHVAVAAMEAALGADPLPSVG